MIDTKYIGQEVINKRGEIGIITKIDDNITVSFNERVCEYCDNAFSEGFLEFNDSSLKFDMQLEKCYHDLKCFDEKIKEPLEELNSLIGLDNIKSQIHELICETKISSIRRSIGLKDPNTTKHMVFMGGPGTGKTTVARIVAKIFNALGVLSSGHVVEVDRSQLIAAYQGQTVLKTTKVLKSALGGVLFIDEAYTICRNDHDDYGYEALDTITKFMEDHRDDLVVIAAGYSKEMIDFISANPGLASRFKTLIYFDDYKGEELFDIFNSFFLANDYRLTEEAKETAQAYFRDKTCHSNARDARNMFEKTIVKQAKRLDKKKALTKDDLITIVKDDLFLTL